MHGLRRRLTWPAAGSAAAVAVMVVVVVVAVQRIDRTLPAAAVSAAVPSSQVVAGTAPVLPWPSQGEAAVAIPALGFSAQSGPEAPVPIASLTKMTVALVVLHDHPVARGSGGERITVTATDVAEYESDVHHDQSTVRVETGEVLSERQMLEALLAESANNIAFALAVWDAGTEAAFVAKMNALARVLGATDTHYADASGVDPRTVSSAADCLRIASVAMADPTFAQVAALKSVTLPLVGTVPNEVSEIGTAGVIGVKSGYTSAAGACIVLAAERVVGGRKVLVLVALTGQEVPPPIPPTTTTTTTTTTTSPPTTTTTSPPAPAAPTTTATTSPPAPTTTSPPPPTTTTTTVPVSDWYVPDPFRFTRPVVEKLLADTEAAVVPVTVSAPGRVIGEASVVWGGASHVVRVETTATARLAAWPGQAVDAVVSTWPVPADARRGDEVGSVAYALGTQHVTVPLRLASTVPEPTWWWRVTHG